MDDYTSNRIASVILSRFLTFGGLFGGGHAIYQFSLGNYLNAALLGVPCLALLGWLTYNSFRNNFGWPLRPVVKSDGQAITLKCGHSITTTSWSRSPPIGMLVECTQCGWPWSRSGDD